MNYFIGHISALEFWRSHSFDSSRISRASVHAARNKNPGFSLKNLLEECDKIGLSRPIDIVVPSLEDRRPSKNLRPHVWGKIPSSSFVKVTNGIYVSTPEFCFVQLARSLSAPKLISIGFELTGRYSIDPRFENGLRTDMLARTTVSKLKQYIERCGKTRGTGPARKAANYLIGNSASPMETNLAMLLCLPSSQGGFGLPKPELNMEVKAPDHRPYGSLTYLSGRNKGSYRMNLPDQLEGARSPTRKFRLDLYWPKHRFALEYDSDTFHANAQKLHADSERRTALEGLGINVVSVTSRQVYNEAEFELLARTTAQHLGKRIRIERADFKERHRRLKAEILSENGQAPKT